jgi:hypothetical protein
MSKFTLAPIEREMEMVKAVSNYRLKHNVPWGKDYLKELRKLKGWNKATNWKPKP